ncbi:MAG: protein TolR [Halothiobacillus sp. 24-54-40]|jgi:biopolymer transport protein TolR|nr:MAG: protein TolR [Halothiobacillus sp. 35-54-62]OYZ85920.1 MAG: protein TolR [Halothiobacillus sp. 24-54-40]OZA78978.1 MAG: protein TolR [Halothiobacillus sp. 39-53-45]HQS03880.1 protein TolR [Halothiobacillus sp.]HQS30085.1 protein TolR [Halothiobacillus sp.]
MDRRARRSRKVVAEINVVPYIDVMLVLLVIFMVTAPMLQQGVEVTPPSAASKALAPSDVPPIVIAVSKTGEYSVSGGKSAPTGTQAMSEIQAYIEASRQLNPKIPVLVKGDKDANYQFVMDAMVAAQKAGVDKVGLVTDQTSNAKAGGGK